MKSNTPPALAGKRVLVLGGRSGIGRATASVAHEKGPQGVLVAGTVVSGAALGGLAGVAVADEEQEEVVSEDVVGEVSYAIRHGPPAIFALVESHDPDRVARNFRGTGGTIFRTNLSANEQEAIPARWRRNTTRSARSTVTILPGENDAIKRVRTPRENAICALPRSGPPEKSRRAPAR